MAHLELARKAQRDLERLGRANRALVRQGLERLAAGAKNLDIRQLRGRSPWKRLRMGDFRVLFRDLSVQELRDLGARTSSAGYLIARIVDRAELERAARNL